MQSTKSVTTSRIPPLEYWEFIYSVHYSVHLRLMNFATEKSELLYGGTFNYVDKLRGGGGQKMSVFVHAQSIKAVHADGGGVSENGKILSTQLMNAPYAR